MNKIARHVVFVMVLAMFASLGSAQTANTGAVTGTVTDPSGAVVPDVTVEIVSEATGAKRTATTGADGSYRFPLLPPGSYRIQASTSGFKVAARSSLPVRVTEITNLDIKLEVGSTNEVITVDTTPPLVEKESSALGRVTDERSVKNLPLVTRNFTQIIALSPGVSVGLTDATQLGIGNGGVSSYTNEDLSVNGARSYDNNFQMDGVSANNQAATYAFAANIAIPNPDTIAEFKVITGQYDSSYGHNAGANVNVVTKSGSNQFHGDVFEFFRNEVLNANSFFFNADGVPRGILRQNQFGGTLGGPIKKDKLLFFGSYQGTRQLNGIATGCGSTFVGPALTNDRSPAGLAALYGGQSGAEGGAPVAADGSNINPIALTLLNLRLPNGRYVVPTPQKIVDGAGRYAFSSPCPFSENQVMANLDFLQSAKSKFAAKFFLSNQSYTATLSSANVPGSPDVFTPGYRNLSLTHDYIFSPTLVNQVEFGFHRIATRSQNSSAVTYPEIGASVIPQTKELASISVAGTETIGGNINSHIPIDVYGLQDTLTYVRGRHNLRFGAGITRTDFHYDLSQGSFVGFLSFPDLLLGLSAAANGTAFSNIFYSGDQPGQWVRDYLIWNPWLYAQDDFKANSRLTFNFGLRYERIEDFADQNGRNASFDPALANPNPPASGSQAGYLLASGFKGTISAGSLRLNNQAALDGDGQNTFGPRIGFAWQVLPKSSRFVLRGGYGIYYSSFVGEQAINTLIAPPWAIYRYAAGTANATAALAAPFGALGPLLSRGDFPIFPTYSPSTQLTEYFLARDYRPPITQQYSLNAQTRLASNYMLEVGYVGARATHLAEGIGLNQAGLASPSDPIRGQTTNTVSNLLLRVPIRGIAPTGLQSTQSTGNSWYNALQVSLTKRFSHGLQFLASYTYARLLDTEGGLTITTGDGAYFAPGDQKDPSARYGPSPTVRPHRLVVSFVYDLPKVVQGRVAGTILNRWSVSGVTTILSGHPLTIFGLNANNVFGINTYLEDRAEFAPGCTKAQLETRGSVTSKLNNYFNSACIGSYPIVGDDGVATGFGNMGTGLVNGPGMSNVDLALMKRIPTHWFGRESAWEFRAEAFNAFNTPHFADPDTNTADGAAFGVISSTIANPRVLQLALKYSF